MERILIIAFNAHSVNAVLAEVVAFFAFLGDTAAVVAFRAFPAGVRGFVQERTFHAFNADVAWAINAIVL